MSQGRSRFSQRFRDSSQSLLSTDLGYAKKQILFFLSRRDHSRHELQQKLSKRFEPQTIAEALSWAHDNRWLRDEQELSNTLLQQLQRQGKGIQKAKQILSQKGLPPPEGFNSEAELEGAQKLLTRKLKHKPVPDTTEEKQKLRLQMMRFLAQRGYTSDIVRKVIYEIFKP